MENDNDELCRDICKRIGFAAAYEQLAEEAAELAQAALKSARIERGINPTPVDEDTAYLNLIEEVADLTVCLKVLNIKPNEKLCNEKLARWSKRLAIYDQKGYEYGC